MVRASDGVIIGVGVSGSLSPIERSVTMFLGIAGVLIGGMAPLLLGGLAEEGRLTASQIGLAAMAEALAMGISTGLAAAVLRPGRLWMIGGTAAFVHMLATLASLWSTGAEIILCRMMTGFAGGILLWITIGMIARSANPERWSGLFLLAQTVVQFSLAAILSITVIPAFGVNGLIICMAGFSGLATIAVFWGPDSYPALRKFQESESKLGIRAYTGLFIVFTQLAAVTAVWVYFERLGIQRGLAAKPSDWSLP
jgi:DHA1 family inner membrane transport protein